MEKTVSFTCNTDFLLPGDSVSDCLRRLQCSFEAVGKHLAQVDIGKYANLTNHEIVAQASLHFNDERYVVAKCFTPQELGVLAINFITLLQVVSESEGRKLRITVEVTQ